MIEFHMKGFGKWCPKITKNHFLGISLPMVGLGIWSVTTLFTLIRSECNKDVIYSFYFFKNFFLSNNSISYYIVNWNIFESFIPNGTHMWMDVIKNCRYFSKLRAEESIIGFITPTSSYLLNRSLSVQKKYPA